MEPKPCPFCGCLDLETRLTPSGWYCVVCRECGAIGPGDGQITTAIDLWNDRVETAQEGD
jgi:Lar family restriction alleviation protein